MRPDVSSLRCFFEPRSIAVIGASRTPGRAGHTLVENLRASFRGAVYPINKEAGEIAGLQAYPSVLDVPGEIDLAVVLVPADRAVEAVEQCAAKKIRGAVVEAADFAEIGPEGKAKQDRMAEVARAAGMRLWGPNCLGVIDTHTGVVTTYQPLRDARPGHVSLVTQSGALAGAVLLQIHESRTFGFAKVCSIGNKADVNETDLLAYLADDPNTKVIAMYLESIAEGRRFIELARRISRTKPIIVLKSGRTALGVSASLSHTASLTGDDRVVEAAFAEAGIIRVGDIGEFLSVIKTFDRLYARAAGRRVAIVCTTGAGGVLAADQLGLHGLEIAQLSSRTMARLYEQFPSWLKADQPLDISPTMMKIGPNRALQYAVSTVLEDENVDAVLLQTFGLPVTAKFEPTAVADIVARSGKPGVAWLYGLRTFLDPWQRSFEDAGMPVMPDLRSAARALQALAEWRESLARVAPTAAPPRLTRSTALDLRKLRGAGQAYSLLRQYGIPIARGAEVHSPEEAAKAAEQLGYPVALKTADLSVAHKSDIGAVHVGLANSSEVAKAAAKIVFAMRGKGDASLYVQEMAASGVEVIVGAIRDPQFGPVVLCGLGGMWAEALSDVVIRLAPIDDEEAAQMLMRLRAYGVLAGARGTKKRDIGILARVIGAIGNIMVDNAAIQSIEINPFIVHADGEGGHAVDVAIEIAAADRISEGMQLSGAKQISPAAD